MWVLNRFSKPSKKLEAGNVCEKNLGLYTSKFFEGFEETVENLFSLFCDFLRE